MVRTTVSNSNAMARAGLSRLDIKRARDSLLAKGQHPSIDAIRIALGNTGSKTTIHRYLKELEEEEGAALKRAGTTSDAILDLVGRLAARLHEEAQAVVDQQVTAATAQRQQVRAEADKLSADLVALRAELAQAHATIAKERAAHSDTQAALQQRTIEAGALRSRFRTSRPGWPNMKASDAHWRKSCSTPTRRWTTSAMLARSSGIRTRAGTSSRSSNCRRKSGRPTRR